jgi:hypothetical protein
MHLPMACRPSVITFSISEAIENIFYTHLFFFA